MARNYTLERSHTTGWWVWQCKDGSGTGSASSKSDARSQARAACGSAVIITPPNVDVVAHRGHLSSFSCLNLDGVRQTYSAAEIDENMFSFFFGLDCYDPREITQNEKAITILKLFGFYRGGTTTDDIRKLHNLSEEQFGRLVRKDYIGATITINDDNTMAWSFPDIS